MRILLLLPRFPYPLDKGDKLRAYHQIVELAKQHEVHLFALTHEPVSDSQRQALQPYCHSLHVQRLHPIACAWHVLCACFRGLPLQVGYWTTHAALRAYLRCVAEVQPDVQYAQMVRTARYLQASAGAKVLDFQDALSLNMERRRERSRGLLRWLLGYEVRTLRRLEHRLAMQMPTTVISRPDAEALGGIPLLVANGVAVDHFASMPPQTPTVDVVFCGNMSYAPNVDAARFLVEEVMPRVWTRLPSTSVLLAGADPKPAVRALASERVAVSGRMPDIRVAYASARLFVAPMRIGSGMQNKLLEAMAIDLPCLTTPIASAPLEAREGEELWVASTAEALADSIVRLLAHPDQAQALAQAGHRYVCQHHSWASATAPLVQLLQRTITEN